MSCRSTSQWLATWQADKDKDPIAILETIPLANKRATDIVLDNSSSTGQKLQQHAVGAVPALSSLVKRSCFLVAMDANNRKELSVPGLVYALQHVVRKGDVLKLLGIITYIQHPLGYKCRVEENNHIWLGANPRHLEDELAFSKQMRTSHISTRSVHKPASCR
ncbi:unnamed protein product [Sphagnum jensenii]|uniref:Uncharacterized protein n=1 Tax=Sphagnum jensenii TaxID=128206 RepID=A0ABP0WAR3_9BRYO